LAVDALPGARLLVDEQERVLLLTRPSSRYPRGIAGGLQMATEITLLETRPSLEAFTRIRIPGHRVVGDLTHLALPERRRAVQVGGFDRSLVELMALRRTEDGIDGRLLAARPRPTWHRSISAAVSPWELAGM